MQKADLSTRDQYINPESEAPKLDQPGAGISWLEMMTLRFIVKPFILQNSDLPGALLRLETSAARLSKLLAHHPPDLILKRVLVPRLAFIEDSSRHWSAALLTRHLAKVNMAAAKAISQAFVATAAQMPPPAQRVAKVKPELEHNTPAAISEFNASVQAIVFATKSQPEPDLMARVIPHPWLGELSHIQWIRFCAFHHEIHRRQLVRIIAGANSQ